MTSLYNLSIGLPKLIQKSYNVADYKRLPPPSLGPVFTFSFSEAPFIKYFTTTMGSPQYGYSDPL
jgi:hypothetical protein